VSQPCESLQQLLSAEQLHLLHHRRRRHHQHFWCLRRGHFCRCNAREGCDESRQPHGKHAVVCACVRACMRACMCVCVCVCVCVRVCVRACVCVCVCVCVRACVCACVCGCVWSSVYRIKEKLGAALTPTRRSSITTSNLRERCDGRGCKLHSWCWQGRAGRFARTMQSEAAL
jgi:hypothetical protein